jgi:hypothetical protein
MISAYQVTTEIEWIAGHGMGTQKSLSLPHRLLSLPKTPSVNSFHPCFTNRRLLAASNIFEKGSLVLGTAGSSIFCYFWRRSAELL